jgi:hypothetical protein
MEPIALVIDGVHYSLHANADTKDLNRFYQFQDAIERIQKDEVQGQNKSFRLYINPEMKLSVKIKPWLFQRIESKPWIPESELRLPAGEELLYLHERRVPCNCCGKLSCEHLLAEFDRKKSGVFTPFYKNVSFENFVHTDPDYVTAPSPVEIRKDFAGLELALLEKMREEKKS